MPITHTRTFRIRQYECDAFGHVNNANYLRLMQETAFDASAAAGYDLERYRQLGHHWLIRATEIEYLRPLVYGDTVEVSTWVTDFRRVSSRRVYQFNLVGSGEPVARAHTDWVYLDAESGQPASIPVEMAAAFFPEGLPENYPHRDPFPTTPPPPLGVFVMHRPVAWSDLDTARHVNNARYLEHIEECGMQVIAAHGWPITRMLAAGFVILLRRHQIQYLRQAVLGDELLITTWVSGVRRPTATRHYLIRQASDGAELVKIDTLGVWVDLASGRPIRIPPELLTDFAPNIVQDSQPSGRPESSD